MNAPKRHSGGGWVDDGRTKRACRQCGADCVGRRRTFCSQPCVDAWIVRTSASGARRVLERRDHGVCALCAFDTTLIRQRLGSPGRWIGYDFGTAGLFVRPDTPPEHVAFLCELTERRGFTLAELRNRRTWWDADHIVAVVRGGGSCGAENLRTLCRPCHRRVTAELAQSRAAERRARGAK